MRKGLKQLKTNEQEITGNWRKDKNDRIEDDDDLMLMTDAERKEEIDQLAREIRETPDRRKRKDKVILRESEAVAEAFQKALGDRNLRNMFDYLYGYEGMEPWTDSPEDDDEDGWQF